MKASAHEHGMDLRQMVDVLAIKLRDVLLRDDRARREQRRNDPRGNWLGRRISAPAPEVCTAFRLGRRALPALVWRSAVRTQR